MNSSGSLNYPLREYSDVDFGNLHNISCLHQMGERLHGLKIELQEIRAENQKLRHLLNQIEERYTLAISSSQVGVWDWNLETNAIYISPNLKGILGYEDEEIPNFIEPWSELVHPDDREMTMKLAQEHLQGLSSLYEVEHRMVHKDGSIRWILARGIAFRDAKGKPYRMAGTDTDITSQKQSSNLIKGLLDRLLMVIKTVGEGITLSDEWGYFSIFNPKMETLTGYSQEEVNKTDNFLSLLYPNSEDLKTVTDQINQVRKNGKIEDLETVIRTKNGEEKTLLVSTSIIWEEERYWYLSIYRDITDRKRTEEELRQSKRFIEQLTDASPELLYLYDLPREKNIYVNRSLESILGYAPEDLYSQGACFFRDIYHPEDVELIENIKQDWLRLADGEVQEVEYQMRHQNGSWVWLRSRNMVFKRNEQGVPIEILGTAIDITTHKLSELQLWESEARLHTIINSASDGLLIVDLQGIIQFVNPSAAQLFNRPIASLVNHEFGQPLTVGKVTEIDLIQGNHIIGVGEMSVSQTYWLGEPVYVVSIRDITERRQAEEALRESEQRFRQLADNIQDVFWLASTHPYQMEYISPAYAEVWGRSLSAVYEPDFSWLDTIDPQDRDRVQATLEQQIQGNYTLCEYRIRTPHGQTRWIWDRAFPIQDQWGNIERVAGIAEDITDRKQAEEALKYRLKLETALSEVSKWLTRHDTLNFDDLLGILGQAMAASRVYLIRLNCEETQLSLTDEWCDPQSVSFRSQFQNLEIAPFSWWFETLRQEDILIINHLDDLPAIAQLEKTYLESLQIGSLLAVPIWTASGKLWGQIKCESNRENPKQWSVEDGRILQVVGEMLYTHTARQEAIAQQLRQQQELARSNAELQQFAYIASHDLQEPLRGVVSFSQLLKEDYGTLLDNEGQNYLHFILSEGERMQGLIRDLLAFSRVGTRAQEMLSTDLEEVLEQVLINLKVSIEESSATLTRDPLPRIYGDRSQMVQLWQNLCSNAIKFRSDRPLEIHLGVQRQDSHWLFWVQDNGIGIDPHYAERIFVLFQRLHTQSHFPGTGIGLAICHKIIMRHGGKIWVESNLNEGATFYFTIADRT